ncbi:MAG: hypothetical protein ACPG4N_13265, partial [Gammaproteobacteria bacterium]
SRLLFYLCPELPFMPMSRPAMATLALPQDVTYRDYANEVLQAVPSEKIVAPLPESGFGTRQEQVMITELLNSTDWWPRRVLSAAFELHGRRALGLPENALDCSPDGRL